jgi:hypothetical protein
MREKARGLLAVTGLLLAGCASMSGTQQRTLSGAAIGAAAGYTIGVTTSVEKGSAAAIGAAAGALGG